jgi:hypothetical protein
MLPSAVGGRVTQEVGFINAPAATVAPWLRDGLGENWSTVQPVWQSLGDVAAELAPSPIMTRNAVVPVDGWSLLLTNGPTGTDVGMVPSLAARELLCCAIRAVCVADGDDEFPARILEVFGPGGTGPLLTRRAITAASDGGEWVFETTGDPLPFERLDQYKRRRKSERFTPDLLHEYLRKLDVPIDVEPDWASARLVALGGR